MDDILSQCTKGVIDEGTTSKIINQFLLSRQKKESGPNDTDPVTSLPQAKSTVNPPMTTPVVYPMAPPEIVQSSIDRHIYQPTNSVVSASTKREINALSKEEIRTATSRATKRSHHKSNETSSQLGVFSKEDENDAQPVHLSLDEKRKLEERFKTLFQYRNPANATTASSSVASEDSITLLKEEEEITYFTYSPAEKEETICRVKEDGLTPDYPARIVQDPARYLSQEARIALTKEMSVYLFITNNIYIPMVNHRIEDGSCRYTVPISDIFKKMNRLHVSLKSAPDYASGSKPIVYIIHGKFRLILCGQSFIDETRVHMFTLQYMFYILH